MNQQPTKLIYLLIYLYLRLYYGCFYSHLSHQKPGHQRLMVFSSLHQPVFW